MNGVFKKGKPLGNMTQAHLCRVRQEGGQYGGTSLRQHLSAAHPPDTTSNLWAGLPEDLGEQENIQITMSRQENAYICSKAHIHSGMCFS